MTKSQYEVHLNTPTLGIIHAADCVVLEESGVPQTVGFRYREGYLNSLEAFPLDPVQLPLTVNEFVFRCRGGIPAFLDDYLPDAWGRRILTRLAFYRDKKRFNANSVIDSLTLLGASRIGALAIVSRGTEPCFENGSSSDSIAAAEEAAHHLHDFGPHTPTLDEMSLLHLANNGSGVGGARPKALIYDKTQNYLAKFNCLRDGYNNARVELACLNMARAAGINVGRGRVITGINGREVLLLERFDAAIGGRRQHLITINGLLKEVESQRDHGGVFRYDDIHRLLAAHSINIQNDLRQLLLVMLFNSAIHNTDDHERNFSLIHRGEGYELAPAYDLVPNLTVGEYHVAGFGYQVSPPRPSEVKSLGKVFGLSKVAVAECAELVVNALSHWREFAADVELDEREAENVAKVFKW